MIASEQLVTKPNANGPATRLTMSVKAPSTTHEIHWGEGRGVAPECGEAE